MFGRFAAQQRRARLAASIRDTGDENFELFGIDRSDGHVVKNKQRLGPDTGQIIDQHGHQIDADRVVATCETSDL